MKLQDQLDGLTLVGENAKKIESLQKEKTKISKLEAYLLSGHAVTGAIIVWRFHLYSYRDAIYDLSKKGYKISYFDTVTEDYTYRTWYLSMFPKDFVVERMEKDN